jgi:L-ascorbate metabolism protein UlaG (beta-lactamase superfamily)
MKTPLLLLLAACSTSPAPVVPSRPPDVVSDKMGPVAITRVAHSTVLIDIAGEVVLTDPWFTEKAGYHHGEPLGLALGELPHLTAVIVSHEHYDHFDIDAFAAYPDKAVPFFVAPGMADAVRRAGFTQVEELTPWQRASVGHLTITATPGAHSVTELTFVVQGAGATVYFAGDTTLLPEHAEIRKRIGPIDVALLPVNGLYAMGKQVVMSDREAAQLAEQLEAKVAVPIHYAFRGSWFTDTFILSYHGTAEGFAAACKSEVHVLAPGQRLHGRPPG